MVKDSPELANRISCGALPLEVTEALFDASRENPLFRKQLEDYTPGCLDITFCRVGNFSISNNDNDRRIFFYRGSGKTL
jgi:hypothetical protein